MKPLWATLIVVWLAGWMVISQARPPIGDAARPAYVPGEVIVKFRKPMSTKLRTIALSDAGLSLRHVAPLANGLELWRLPAAPMGAGASASDAMADTQRVVDALNRRSDVEYAQVKLQADWRASQAVACDRRHCQPWNPVEFRLP